MKNLKAICVIVGFASFYTAAVLYIPTIPEKILAGLGAVTLIIFVAVILLAIMELLRLHEFRMHLKSKEK